MAENKAKKPTQREYRAKRDARIEELYLREGLEPRDIAAKMLAEETLASESEDSAMRTVRGVVRKLRERLDGARLGDSKAEIATNEIDALERKLARLRQEHARQESIAQGELGENCARSQLRVAVCLNAECTATGKHVPFIGPLVGVTMTNTPQGPMTSYRAMWPAGVRQKASKDAAALAEKIAEIEIALTAKRSLAVEAEETGDAGGLTIIESDKSIQDLIKENLIVGSFGRKGKDGGGGTGSAARA